MRGSENNSTSAFIAASKVGGAGSSILKLSAPKPRRQNLPSSSAIDRGRPRWQFAVRVCAVCRTTTARKLQPASATPVAM